MVLEGYSYLECPRWHEGRLWVSDFYTHQVVATDGGGRTKVVAEVPNQPAGLGWLPDGRLLVVSMRDRKVLRRDGTGELVEHADLYAVDAVHEFPFLAPGRPERYEGCEEVPMSVREWPRKASHLLGVARISTPSIYLSPEDHSRFSLLR